MRAAAIISTLAASLVAGQAHALTLAECKRTTHPSHGGEIRHMDLGEGRVVWLDWWSMEGTAKGFSLVECESGEMLKFRTADDWCHVTRRDFLDHHGGALLPSGWSPLELLRETYPEEDWHEWHFVRVPNGFWNSPKNRRAYFRWLGESYCGFTHPDQWLTITRQDVRDTGGGSLLSVHYQNSMTKFHAAALRSLGSKTRRRRVA